MDAFETVAIESSSFKSRVWYRYVDDTFIIWPDANDKRGLFRNNLNNHHPKIKFTMELIPNKN